MTRRPARDEGRAVEPERRYGEKKNYGERKPYGERREYGERRPYGERRESGERKFERREDRPERREDRRPREDRAFGDRPSFGGPRPERRERFDREERREDRRPREDRREERVTHEEEQLENNLLVGRNPIREALRAGRDIEKLLVARGELIGSAREIVAMAKDAKIIVQEVERVRLDQMAPNHQGLIAVASAYSYKTVDDMLALAKERGEAPLLVILDGVTDPHNLGAIIRSAECAGAHGVIIPERRAVGLTPAAVKASAGAVEYLPVAREVNLTRTIERLKKEGVWVYGTAMNGEDYRKVNFSGAAAIVIGSEGEGISRLVAESCDKVVSLPMKGHIDSLNASVAAGILLYAVAGARA
ncbi:MAG: 23S rRNA (guanosine(2251)-2'-O)-methyltransferase RlmB [Clostridia bacterium]|nr:23S rRNA (guanosine(2251)-2'-O)-methyltransferase RlmB [Clostridia bacterium]